MTSFKPNHLLEAPFPFKTLGVKVHNMSYGGSHNLILNKYHNGPVLLSPEHISLGC